MVPLLLCLLALQADDSLSTLVQQLGDDVVEVREKATAELLRRGEAQRPALEKALKEATAPEVAARLRAVLARFDADRRRREFKGGPIVDELGALLTCDYDAKTHQLSVTLELTNFGTTDRTIAPIRSWNISLPRNSSSSTGSEGEIEVKQLTGGGFGGRFSSRMSCGPVPQRPSLILKPGERKEFKHTLDASALTAGDHEVKVKYFSKRLAGCSEDVESNAQKFQVLP